MTIVRIPFRPFFRKSLLDGVKTCTARTSRMGAGGDRFQAFGAWFELRSVTEETLHAVSDLWRQEGCESREHFVSIWNSIHPKVGYIPHQVVYLHRFKKVGDSKEVRS